MLRLPPMPWCNVIANERFGFITSETGAGCTWSRNSQANRLTPWSNDPVCDPHGEALYLRDEDNGEFWSPLPGPCPAAADYEMAHGFGCSCCRVTAHELEHETTMFVPRADPVKLVRLRLKNTGNRVRRLSLFSQQRLVLGSLPPEPGTLTTWIDGGLFARNPKSADFSDGAIFCFGVFRGGKPGVSSFTCDRRSFIGANGNARSPQALRGPSLDNASKSDGDCCFAWQWAIELQAGETMGACIVLGEAVGETELEALRLRYRDMAAVDAALEDVKQFWRELLGGVRVRTPSPDIDLMINGWLAYQTIACRMWGRTAFYQSSGAFGFRDQLQDAGNLTLLWPELTRRQILLHTRHQFVEGDVLHWWHEAPVGRGVRTRFSDDLLWLPYVTASYLRATGDALLLDETAPFITAPLLKPGEDENYLKPEASGRTASVLEHCCLAIDRSLTRGAHGLPLMGTGDWNDGMNRVGREGRGESVWLGFFLFEILGDFIPMVQAHGDDDRAQRYAAHRQSLLGALNDAGWDGGWYRRAYYDNGKPLGTRDADECRIDGLAQSWAVLSGAAPADRAAQAMDAAEEHLISETDGLIRLLTPPFVNTPEDPGYIKGYVAGVRENGGQYTHAACWMVQALARLGRRDRAARLLEMLSPLSHTRTREDVERYKVEPYVIAADVYGAAPHVGRGGWTWYTGSAGWAWHVAIESVLGLRIENGDTLVVKPCVPDEWPEFCIDYRHPNTKTRYHLEVRNPDSCSERVVSLVVDGNALPVTGGEARFPIARDGAMHSVVITLGGNE
jgi:N,N'-diacetylchitobiose phosphorylase